MADEFVEGEFDQQKREESFGNNRKRNKVVDVDKEIDTEPPIARSSFKEKPGVSFVKKKY